MAEVQDLELTEVIVDVESAGSLDRAGMGRLLDVVASGTIDVVIVFRLDRLTRSVRDLGELLERFQKRGVSLVSVCESLDTATAAGRLVLHILGSVAEWERQTIAERTRAIMRHKKSSGERVGTVPFGFRLAADRKHLEPDEAEQGILSLMRELRDLGFTLVEVADELNRRGFRTRRGGLWRLQYIAANIASLAAAA